MFKIDFQFQKEVLRKFFLPLIFAFLTFAYGAYFVHSGVPFDFQNGTTKVLAQIALGISFGFGVEFLEIVDLKKRTQLRLLGFIFIILQAYLTTLIESSRQFAYLYANFFLLSHLFVALSFWFNSRIAQAPSEIRNKLFWNQNWRIFIGFQSAALVNGVLFLGLTLGLLSLDFLLGIKLPEKLILYLFLFLATVGGTYYLAALQFSEFKDDEESKILNTLVKFIFPLLQVLYFLILYVYLFKIIAQWSLPRGSVGWLVSGLSILICLSHLIIKPVQEKFSHHKLPQLIWRLSFIAIIPFLVLLFISIFRRISDYGLTENRYLLLVLTLWMFTVSLTHLKPEKSKLQFIPLSLFFITFITLIGPLSAYQVSFWSQKNQVLSSLNKINGKVLNNEFKFEGKVEPDDQIKFVRHLQSFCNLYGITKVYSILEMKPPKVTNSYEEFQCYYKSGFNDTTNTPFAKLISSTGFEVIARENFSYFYEINTSNAQVSLGKTFEFYDDNSNNWIQFDKNEYAVLTFSNSDNKITGQSQLIFQKSGQDQITWQPKKGELKIIDLKPLMLKLSKVSTDYKYKDHPEDQLLKSENSVSKLAIKIQSMHFKQDKDFNLVLEHLSITAAATEK